MRGKRQEGEGKQEIGRAREVGGESAFLASRARLILLSSPHF